MTSEPGRSRPLATSLARRFLLTSSWVHGMIQSKTKDDHAANEAQRALDLVALEKYHQGDYLATLTSLPVVTVAGVRDRPTPCGVILIAQTCDIVRENPPTVQAAKLTYLLKTNDAQAARDGKRPRFVHVPTLGDSAFADLDLIATIDKRMLVCHARKPGVETDEDVRVFGRAVGRRPGRFAFPDEVVLWFNKLTDLISSKSRKLSTPEGRLLAAVEEARVEAADGWTAGPPWHLTLVIIVKPGTLPTFVDDEPPKCPDHLATWLYGSDGGLQRASGEIAARMEKEETGEGLHHLWEAYAESWAVKCQPPKTESHLGTVAAEIVSDDEFTTLRNRRSETLDLDHLSAPRPH